MAILATHQSILHSTASLLILPLSSEAVVLDLVISRLMSMYPSTYRAYQELAHKGELALGSMWLHPIAKQTTGLGVGSNKTADAIAHLISHHHPTHSPKPLTFLEACKLLQPRLYELMRYRHIHHVAIYLGVKDIELALKLWQIIHDTLPTPRVTIDVHIDKSLPLESFLPSHNLSSN